MNFKGIRVLLLDGFCRQNAVLLQELHKLGCVVTTLNSSKLDVGYASRYPAKKLLDTEFRQNLRHYEALILEAAKSGRYDVIFPVLEESTKIIAQNIEEIGKYVKTTVPPLNAFEKASDKQLTMKLCRENGINCPKTKMDSETLEEYLQTVRFPLALKPREGRGSVGFKKVNSREELYKLIQDGTVAVEEYVIQEFIAEAETHRVSYTMIDQNNRVKSSLIAKSTRPFPLEIGTNSRFESVDMPEMRRQAELLLQLMGWQGYASVCFIESAKDGIPKVMEINGRISASFKISVEAGLPIVQQLLEYAYGAEVTPMPESLNYGRQIQHSQSAAMWFLKSPERFRKSDRKHTGLRKDVVFSFADPLPYIAYSLQCLGKYKTDMKKRERH